MSKVNEIQQKITKLNVELIEAKKRTQVKCSHCNKSKQIQNVLLFQEEWYEEPYS